MNFIVSCVLLFVALVNIVLGTNILKGLGARITGCVYIDVFSKESVELKCELHVTESKCFFSLFKSDSSEQNRLRVKKLKTVRCRSSEFDESLAELFPNLIELDISNLGLLAPIKKEHFNFEFLKVFRSSFNQIYKFDDFSNLKEIKEIDFSFNNIENISATKFDWAISLESMNLSHNSISHVDNLSFINYKDLRIIDLGNNSLKTFDMSLFKHNDKLEEIHIENNHIIQPFDDKFNSMSFNSFITLNVAGNRIQEIHEIITKHEYPILQVLDLSGNPMNNFNLDILKYFHSLQYVYLSKTQSQTFDFGVFRHPEHLRSLDISDNYLQTINYTSKFGYFTSIHTLDLAGNELSDLDDVTMKRFPKLSKLDISQNRFSGEYISKFKRRMSGDLQLSGEPHPTIGYVDDNHWVGGGGNSNVHRLLRNPFFIIGMSFCAAIVCSIMITIFFSRRKSSIASKQISEN